MTMMHKGMANRATRTIRFFVLVSAASVLAVGALAACGSSATSLPPPPPPVSQPPPPPASQQPDPPPSSTSNDAVTGTVSWPDGQPAAGASVYFYDYEPQISLDTGGWSNGKYWVPTLPSDGSYSLGGCPCNDLTAYIYLPGQPGGDPDNGGQDCWIIAQDDSGNYAGDPANPGDVINWQALNMPCDSTWYASDQAAVQSTASLLAQQSVGYAGTWQAAEARASGSGS
jgi:hypothetical protein